MTSNKLKILDEVAAQIPSNRLPTNADVIKAIYFEKDSATISKDDSIKIVLNQIDELWKRAAIPTVSKQRFKKKLITYFEEYSKISQDRTDRKSYDIKANNFKVTYMTILLW